MFIHDDNCYAVTVGSGMEDNKQDQVDGNLSEDKSSMPSSKQEEEVVKKKYGGILPKKPPLISKDHERAYFDSADWALGKQGADKPKGPLEALRPKLQFLDKVLDDNAFVPTESTTVLHPIRSHSKPGNFLAGKGELELCYFLIARSKPTQQQTRYRKSPYAPADGEDAGSASSEDATANE
ncbi:hypothetical protein POTOM_017381 [Populus tomentosa]|uniref:Endosulphine n=1 Tax=Populus tomentosa TaxID=118781 RepID=A0A8X7ZXE6_POPTO|nr:hypothetical protein POTOM_017381 [Populus tomentosa]